MSMLLQTLPSRRQSRRRARIVRARTLFVCVALLLSAYLVWSTPAAQTKAATTATPAAAPREAEPEQSVDTEGALSGGRQASDAALYVAER